MKLQIIMLSISILATITACTQKPQDDNNPLLSDFKGVYETPPFEEIKTEHYLPAFKVAIAEGMSEIDKIVNDPSEPTFDNTIVALEEAGSLFTCVSSIFSNLNTANTSPEMQAAAREISPLVTEYTNDINLNEKLFERVKSVYDRREQLQLNNEQTMLLVKTYKKFVRNGANLAPDKRERFREINKELSELSLIFNENEIAEINDFILHITNKEDLAGLPESVIEMAEYEAKERKLDGWVFSLHIPSYLPFMQYADNRPLREKLYKAYVMRCNRDNKHDNKKIVAKIVNKRLERAQMLGYKSYADYVLEERMAQSAGNVDSFLDKIFRASHTKAKDEMVEVQNFAKTLGFSDVIQRWDWLYYSEKLKKHLHNIDDEMIKPYFELSRTQQGIFDLANRLYGINFKYNPQISVYHPDVKAYEVTDSDGRFLAVLYLDFHPRQSKSSGAWMTSFREQSVRKGKNIRPLVSIVCNFSKPTDAKPSLLTFSEVQTFLHEFGHAMHGILSDVTYESLSGTSVYRDFVELPSQLMENWAVEKEWLDLFAVHNETGEKIPATLIEKIEAVEDFQSGYLTDRQLSFATLDMAWHTLTKPLNTDVVSFTNEAMSKFELFPLVQGACMSTSFGHLFSGGYAAGYYGYKWSEVLDADAFSVFKRNGIFDTATAMSLRDNILSKGGSAHPMELYVKFRGQEPTIDAFLSRSGLK